VLAAILVWQRSGPAKKAADQAPHRVPLAITPPKRERLALAMMARPEGLDAVQPPLSVRKAGLSDGTLFPASHASVSRSAPTGENPRSDEVIPPESARIGHAHQTIPMV
jgi:hypothetical protein